MSIKIRTTSEMFKQKYADMDKLFGMTKTAQCHACGTDSALDSTPKVQIEKIEGPGMHGMEIKKEIGPTVRVVRNGDVFDNIASELGGKMSDIEGDEPVDMVKKLFGDHDLFSDEDKNIDWEAIDKGGDDGATLDDFKEKIDETSKNSKNSEEDAELKALKKLVDLQAEGLEDEYNGALDSKKVELLENYFDLIEEGLQQDESDVTTNKEDEKKTAGLKVRKVVKSAQNYGASHYPGRNPWDEGKDWDDYLGKNKSEEPEELPVLDTEDDEEDKDCSHSTCDKDCSLCVEHKEDE